MNPARHPELRELCQPQLVAVAVVLPRLEIAEDLPIGFPELRPGICPDVADREDHFESFHFRREYYCFMADHLPFRWLQDVLPGQSMVERFKYRQSPLESRIKFPR